MLQVVGKKRVSNKIFCLVILLLWTGLLFGTVSSAQETQLETITVTADKREENVQKVTTAITVLSDVDIEDMGIKSTRDIWQYVPNLSTSNAGSRDYFSVIRLRGIRNTPFGDPAVSLYIDDISYSGVYAFDNTLFDVQRIEVLKGPQGTLYGKNTEGGVINVVTKAPTNVFEGRAGLEFGNFNAKGINGVVSGPVVRDTLFFRLSALKSVRDGYIENKFNGRDIDSQDTTLANVGLFFTPTEKLDFGLNLKVHEFDDNGGFPMVAMDKDRFRTVTGIALDDFQGATSYAGDSSSKSRTGSLRVKYQADFFDLVSISTYRKMDNESSLDGDFTPAEMFIGFNAVESGSVSQELRLQSRDENSSLKWLVGVYYGKDEKEYNTGYKLDKVYADIQKVPLYAEDAHEAQIDSEDMAVFGQGTIRFFDDALGLTAGLRYEHSKRTLDHDHTFMGAPIVASIRGLEMTNSELLPKVALDYRISQNSMIYTSVARGYKAGGFAYAVDDPKLVAFDPEISTAFELGIKNELPELGLRFNAAAFYTKVDEYQDRVQIDPMTVLQKNVSEADIYGFELEAAWKLTASLSVNGFIGYTHARYGDYLDPMTGANYEDNAIALVPEYDSGLFLEYRNPWGLFARAEVQYIGSMYLDRTNKDKQEPYTLLNMKIGYEQENWDVYLAAKNLTDKEYVVEGYEDPSLGYVGCVGPPRTITLTCSYRF